MRRKDQHMTNPFKTLWNRLRKTAPAPAPELHFPVFAPVREPTFALLEVGDPVSSLDYAQVAATEAGVRGLTLDQANALSTAEVLVLAGNPTGAGWTGEGVRNQFQRLMRLADAESQRAAWKAAVATLQAGDVTLAKATVHVEPMYLLVEWG